jgi:hypothetical protein
LIKRTNETHLANIKEIEATRDVKTIHYKGVKKDNCFVGLNHFNITDSLPLDWMHDLPEGVIMKNLTLLMLQLKKDKLYDMKMFNEELIKFKYNRKDGKSKIPAGILCDTKKQIKLSATHAWTLSRILPIMLGTRFATNEYYLHFTNLLEISRFLMDDRYDDEKLPELAQRISDYLQNFKILYPDIPISYKMHNMVHYPRCIRMSGLPFEKWTMRFDSKHRYFKQVHGVTHNHINLLSSLTKRHSNLGCYHLNKPNYFQSIDFGTEQIVDSQIMDLVSIFLNNITTLKFYNFVFFNRCKYTVGDIVVTKRKTNINPPQFAKLNTIVHEFISNRFYFFIEDLITGDYYNCYTGYQLLEKIDACPKLISIDDLAHFHSLNTYFLTNEHNQIITIVVPKYAL